MQNEFRYGTMERLLLGVFPFFRLLLIRSGAAAVVSCPAVVIPFLAACARYPELVRVHTLVVIVLVYVSPRIERSLTEGAEVT